MMSRNNFRPFLPVVFLYIILNGLFVGGRRILANWGMDQDVLIIGNSILFLVSFLSYLVSLRGLRSVNPHAFIRAMYGSFMIKFFICVAAAFFYIMTVKKDVNKPALFACMGLYLVYSFLEVSILTKLSKQKKNA